MMNNPKYYALQIKGMSLAKLIEERNKLMDEISEIEDGMCDEDIFCSRSSNHIPLQSLVSGGSLQADW